MTVGAKIVAWYIAAVVVAAFVVELVAAATLR